MTVDNLELLFDRLWSVFLRPLVSIVFLSMIVYLVHGGTGFGNQEISGLSKSIVDFVSSFFKGDTNATIDAIKAIAKDYGKPITDTTTILAAAAWFVMVFLFYLIDRVIFYAGYFTPPTLEFDMDAYGHLNADTTRVCRLMSLLTPSADSECADGTTKTCSSDRGKTPSVNFASAYGVVRAYLGDKNTDKYRVAVRGKILRAIDVANAAFSYAKTYLIVSVFLVIFLIWKDSQFSALNFICVFLVLLLISVLACLFYASMFKQLVEYDIDSFIWERGYNDAQRVKIPDALCVSNADVTSRKVDVGSRKTGWPAKYLAKKYVRFSALQKLNI